MATATTNIATVSNPLRAVFGGIWKALMAVTEANSRSKEFTRLSEMSDKQLSEIGLKRTDIARHVFRDMLYL